MKFAAHDVPRDGNCLFHSILTTWLHYVGKDVSDHGTGAAYLRELSVRHLVGAPQSDEILMLLTEGIEPPLRISDMASLPLDINPKRRVLGEPMHRIIVSSEEAAGHEQHNTGKGSVLRRAEAYARKMRTPGQWGGESEIKSCAELLGVQIVVYCEWVRGEQRTRLVVGAHGAPKLRLLYDEGSAHYAPLLPAS